MRKLMKISIAEVINAKESERRIENGVSRNSNEMAAKPMAKKMIAMA